MPPSVWKIFKADFLSRFPFVFLLRVAAAFLIPTGGNLHAGEKQESWDFQALAQESRRQGGTALIVAVNGHIVYSQFAEGFGPDTRVPAMSITKTLVALAAWQMQGNRWLSLQDPVGKYLPSWKNHPARLVDLLDFSAGLAGGREVFYRRNLKDKPALALKQRPRSVSGTGFAYGPASYEVLGEILTGVLKSQSGAHASDSPLAFFQKTLMTPLSASVASWRTTSEGTPFYSAGAWMSPRQLLALGELIRRDGRIGWRRVLPKGFLAQLQSGSTDFPIYHLGVWRNLAAAGTGSSEVNIEASIGQFTERAWWARRCISKSAPPDLLALAGSHGQRVYVIPGMKMVIVRTGRAEAGAFDDARLLSALVK
jgi:CubicO group peptidase (beta-lactamase class C family)